MAKVIRPLHSDFARGKFAKSLVYNDGLWRQYVSVTGPRRKVCTPRQREIRNMIKTAWERWRTLSLGMQDCWERGRDRRWYARGERKFHHPQRGAHLYVATYMHYHLYPIYDRKTKIWYYLGEYGTAWDDNYECWFAYINGPWGACAVKPGHKCTNYLP